MSNAQTIQISALKADDETPKKTYTYEELRQLISNKPSKVIPSSAKKEPYKSTARSEAVSKNK